MGKFIDLTGQRFGKLTVIERVENSKDNKAQWKCKCDCGRICTSIGRLLITGRKKTCGHCKRYKDLTGEVFGRLIVLGFSHYRKDRIYWNCKCECGNEKAIDGAELRRGKTKSCGCLGRERARAAGFKDITGQRFGKLVAVQVATKEYQKRASCLTWQCKCDCGNVTYVDGAQLRYGHVRSCGCVQSFAEKDIASLLTERNIAYRKQFSFADLRSNKNWPLRFDFAIYGPELTCLIEYQGIQHYKDFGRFGKREREETDQLKRDYCNENNIPLYEIRYDQKIEPELDRILKLHNLIIPCQAADEAEGVTTIPEGSRAEAKLLSPKRCASANEYADEEIVYSPE